MVKEEEKIKKNKLWVLHLATLVGQKTMVCGGIAKERDQTSCSLL